MASFPQASPPTPCAPLYPPPYAPSLLFIQLNAQLDCSKGVLEITLKIDIKSAPSCFGYTTIIRELAVCALLKL